MTARRAGLAVAAIAVAGALLRLWLAWYQYPVTGDPVFSYSYRALLLAHGEPAGLFLMWHPPGYPLLLAAVAWLTLGLASPYAAGVGLSAAASAALVWIVDRLAADCVRWPVTRIAVASFVAFYEGLATVAAAPLTEPVYLALLYGAVLAATAARITTRRALAIGGLLGLAATLRLEGMAPLAGLCLYLGLRPRPSQETAETGGARPWPAVWMAVAGLAVCAWIPLAAFGAADSEASIFYRQGLTIPAAAGIAGQIRRAVECVYLALVEWLPQTILLPYFALAAVGLAATWSRPRTARLDRLLAAALLPQLALVVLTIMHKRSGAFLLPAVALWLGFGLEFLARQGRASSLSRRAALFAALAIAANLLQAGRIPFFFLKRGVARDPATFQQARLLTAAGAPPGKVWAFGGEPEVYTFWGVPVVYPFPERHRGYNQTYSSHAGEPSAFVAALRAAGFSYLTFSLAPSSSEGAGEERQIYGDFAVQPRRADLATIAGSPARLGLEPLGSLAADRGSTRVYAFRIRGDRP
ncbi:MAG TPA: hypothetical protein VF756_11510 [Thermoanaerobaculia bacterium]